VRGQIGREQRALPDDAIGIGVVMRQAVEASDGRIERPRRKRRLQSTRFSGPLNEKQCHQGQGRRARRGKHAADREAEQ
jgi:hypothetical protein